MHRGSTGRYEITTTVGESVRAFVPEPLPPLLPLDLSGSRQRLLEQANLACGRLDGVSALLPYPELFIYGYVRREAVLSSQIEGTQSSLSDLLLFELDEAPGAPFNDVVEVSNYVAALEHGMTRLREGFPLSNRLLREMHAKLLARGRGADKSPGEFRRSQNWIGGTRPGNARFVPPPPFLVEDCMAALERFIHDDTVSLPALVRAAVAHVQFETIHPFLDGNGRVGRLLIALMLHQAGILRQPLLYLSLFMKQHRAEYYRLLDTVRIDGDWEAWLDFFLEGVAQTAGSAVELAQRLLVMFRDDERRILELGRGTASLLKVYEALRARPVAAISDIAMRAELTFPTASRAIEILVQAEIARELTGGRRNRVYSYNRYVAILNEGTELL
ncbi:Protein adenylyltransferase [Gammaproteobacteria bacterium]